MQKNDSKFYDDIYFDTDEEISEEGTDDDRSPGIGLIGSRSKQPKDAKTKSTKRRMQTNEELLYDPMADDQDEAWVIQKVQQSAPDKSKDAHTDAILTCPLCFSPLCYNCQRHEKYQNQYRAMFVTNCQVKKTERYRYAKDDQEAYYIVTCKTCETHVAMMDEDEIFHFFNVIAT